MTTLSEQIKAYRQKHQLSQRQFAERLHVTKQAVSKWETNRGYPDVSLIPVIAQELGVSIDSLMGKHFWTRRRLVILSISSVVVIVLIALSPMMYNLYQERQIYTTFTSNLEDTIDIQLPSKGTLEHSDYENWFEYGNYLSISQMSYLVFSNESQIKEFETTLEQDSRWVTVLPDESLQIIPLLLEGYTDDGDYYIIYNVNTEKYNDFTEQEQVHEYIFLIYQKDYHRLLVFDYLD